MLAQIDQIKQAETTASAPHTDTHTHNDAAGIGRTDLTKARFRCIAVQSQFQRRSLVRQGTWPLHLVGGLPFLQSLHSVLIRGCFGELFIVG